MSEPKRPSVPITPSPAPAPAPKAKITPDAHTLALRANPRFKLVRGSGQGFHHWRAEAPQLTEGGLWLVGRRNRASRGERGVSGRL